MNGGCARGPSTSTGDAVANGGTVRGSVAYRERVALPPDAVVEVWIVDASALVIAVPVLAETTVMPEGRQVPIPFELPFDSSRIEPDHDYTVKAVIRSEGRILFATDTDRLVITKGRPLQADLWLVRSTESPDAQGGGLLGTVWVLEDLQGSGVLADVQATLEFPEAGKVAGSGSCNRIFGTVEIASNAMRFSPLGSTRMACPEAVMTQEGKYLKALQDGERFAIDGTTLSIYSRGTDRPLRFTRTSP